MSIWVEVRPLGSTIQVESVMMASRLFGCALRMRRSRTETCLVWIGRQGKGAVVRNRVSAVDILRAMASRVVGELVRRVSIAVSIASTFGHNPGGWGRIIGHNVMARRDATIMVIIVQKIIIAIIGR